MRKQGSRSVGLLILKIWWSRDKKFSDPCGSWEETHIPAIFPVRSSIKEGLQRWTSMIYEDTPYWVFRRAFRSPSTWLSTMTCRDMWHTMATEMRPGRQRANVCAFQGLPKAWVVERLSSPPGQVKAWVDRVKNHTCLIWVLSGLVQRVWARSGLGQMLAAHLKAPEPHSSLSPLSAQLAQPGPSASAVMTRSRGSRNQPRVRLGTNMSTERWTWLCKACQGRARLGKTLTGEDLN